MTDWLPGGPAKSMGSFQPDTESGEDGYPPHQFEMIYPGESSRDPTNEPTSQAAAVKLNYCFSCGSLRAVQVPLFRCHVVDPKRAEFWPAQLQ